MEEVVLEGGKASLVDGDEEAPGEEGDEHCHWEGHISQDRCDPCNRWSVTIDPMSDVIPCIAGIPSSRKADIEWKQRRTSP